MTPQELKDLLVKNKLVTIEQAEYYYNAINDYKKEIVRHSSPNAPRMTMQDHDNFFKLYSGAFNAFLELKNKLGENAPLELTKYVKGSLDVLGEQYMVFKTVTDKKEYCTLGYALDRETNKVLDGDINDSNYKVRGGQSDRYVVNGVDKKGRVVTGVFTKAKYINTKDPFSRDEDYMAIHQLQASDGDRIDSRNSAMSDVANLLGRDDLLAHSQEMKYFENGKQKSGTFMNFADGTDVKKLSADKRERYYQVNIKDPYTPKAKKDALDLSIIDYICFNVDRHAANMMYKYKKCLDGEIRLDGIIGIDNDGSFAKKNEVGTNENFNRLQALDDTVVISESMAKKISNLKPEILAAVLRKNHLDEESIKAACERFNNVKQRIENGKATSDFLKTPQDTKGYKANRKYFFSDPVGFVHSVEKQAQKGGDAEQKHMIVVVPDKDIKDINLNGIADASEKRGGPDGPVSGVCLVLKKVHSEETKTRYMNEAKEREALYRKRAPKFQILISDMRTFCKEISGQFQGFATKTEDIVYNAFAENATEISQMSATIAGKKNPTKEDMDRLEMYFTKMGENCENFMNQKNPEKGIPDDEMLKARIAQVKKVQKDLPTILEKYRKAKEVLERNAREEALIQGDIDKLFDNSKDEKTLPLGTISKAEIEIDFNRLFNGNYANDISVRGWKDAQVKEKGADFDWKKEVFNFNYPTRNDCPMEFVNQIDDDCNKLYRFYKAALKKDPVDIGVWQKNISPLVDNLRFSIDQYNEMTDNIFLEDPRMHALSTMLTGLRNVSDKIADKAIENVKANEDISAEDKNAMPDERHDRLLNRLRYFSMIINKGAEKHKNSKDFVALRDALDACANSDSLDSNLLRTLSQKSGTYLTNKTKGIHVKSYADPIREYRLEISKSIKEIADANIERVKSLPGATPIRASKVQKALQ